MTPDNETLRRLMSTPTPPELISQRVGAGGNRLSYIEWGASAALLSEEVPDWRWEILMMERDETGWVVRGRLSLGDVYRDGVGFAPHKKNLEDNGAKDACSDAFKRAAAMFGVGLDLYGKGATARALSEIEGADEPPTTRRRDDEPPTEIDGDAHRKRAFAIGAKLVNAMKPLGVTENDIWSYVTTKYGIASRKDISPEQWKEIADGFAKIEKNTPSQVALAERIKAKGDSAWLTQEQADAYISGDLQTSANALLAHADRFREAEGWTITINRRLRSLEFGGTVGVLLNTLRENPTKDDVLILASCMVDEGAWQKRKG